MCPVYKWMPCAVQSLVLVLLATGSLLANNVTISNVITTGQDTGNDFVLIQFDISWENSWRISGSNPDTYDAVWIFVKYRVAPGGQWFHATLNTSGHTAPAGSQIISPADGKGVFIERDAPGTGTVNFTGVQLRWNYGVDGLSDDDQNVDVRVLGIEMVYIPTGSFAVGSGGTGANEFTLTTIDTADATVVPSGLGEFEGMAGGFPTGQTPPDDPAWPNGYSAFYIQKYEITQGQYAEFLNLLTYTQQGNRFPNAFGAQRHTIQSTPPGFTAHAPDRACNHVDYADGIAYADWAGLRPITEMEYEKAGRGQALRVPDEYAWGTTNVHNSPYVITNDGLPDATVDAAASTGNAAYPATYSAGPLRAGIFAASINPVDREEAGASFYGVMELSGNLWEAVITIGHAEGRAFLPEHGDGHLTLEGAANVAGWSDSIFGAAQRGGAYDANFAHMRLSDRIVVAGVGAGLLRPGRTAP